MLADVGLCVHQHFDTISYGFGRLFAILNAPFPKHNGGPLHGGKISLQVEARASCRCVECQAALTDCADVSSPVNRRVSLRHYRGMDGAQSFPDAGGEKREHGNVAECPCLQYQKHDLAGWRSEPDTRDPRLIQPHRCQICYRKARLRRSLSKSEVWV